MTSATSNSKHVTRKRNITSTLSSSALASSKREKHDESYVDASTMRIVEEKVTVHYSTTPLDYPESNVTHKEKGSVEI